MRNQSTLFSQLWRSITLGIPLIATQLLGYAPTVIDTIMAGDDSPLTQASVGLAGQIYSMIFLFMLGTTIAISATVSHYHGNGDARRIRRSFQQGLWLSILLGVLTFFLVLLASNVPYWIGTVPNVAREANHYLLVMAPGAAIFVVALSGRFFLEGMAHPRSNIIIQVSLLPVNIIGNYVFLTGWWIFPKLGVPGMALATITTFILYALLLFYGIYRNPRWRNLRLFQSFAPIDWLQIRLLLKVGVPIAVAIVMEAGLFNVIGLIVSRDGELITAANQIALNLSGMMFMLPLGLSSAMTIRAANEQGRGDYRAVYHVALGGIILGVLLMCVSASVLISLRESIAALYTDNAEIIGIVSSVLAIIAIFQIADGTQVIAAGILRGLQDTRVAMYFAILGYWILGFPAGLTFAYVFDFGLYGLWGGLAVGLAINAVLGSWRVFSLIKHKQST
ncbi:MATE family efflux transporter [Suttonella sp. R2A3]|uniref:MATE family efflux transporter n=1 Tax=Suttonella sp. R2A3 TaxID=2908648 RepID=UPI001F31BED3|nr:MATE family efflux transporter [Suttonella sp. R2A3]UJF24249.1 MATE family efflux transporter [Suttonella sp. R2A3]